MCGACPAEHGCRALGTAFRDAERWGATGSDGEAAVFAVKRGELRPCSAMDTFGARERPL